MTKEIWKNQPVFWVRLGEIDIFEIENAENENEKKNQFMAFDSSVI